MSDVKMAVTFRHTKPTDALKHYVEEKIHRFSRPLQAHVVLSVNSSRQMAEVELHTHGTVIHGKEETADLYSALIC